MGHIVELFIDGKSVDSHSHYAVTSPADGRTLWQYTSSSPKDVQHAITAAEAAFDAWSGTSPGLRQEILLRAADLFSDRRDALRDWMKLEIAADDAFIQFNINATIKQLKDVANLATNIRGSVVALEDDRRRGFVLKEPYGIVLGIAPWNAPYILGTRAVSAALAAGNTVILKGPELAPRCFRAIADIFFDAGLPKGCLNLIFAAPHDASTVTEALIKHPSVAKINFTGSAAIGSIVASTAGKYVKPVLLELGGKATAIVFEDADLGKAAQACAVGAFLHSGQVCMGTERFLVQSSVADEFTVALQKTIDAMYFSPDSRSALISPAATRRVQRLVDDAIGKGAQIKCLPGNARGATASEDRPIVLGDVDRGMDLYYKESFGPVATFHTFETEEEAIATANDTEYGLTGAVFTKDLQKGLRVSGKYKTGAVHINSMSIHDEAALPHGGFKSSGFGKFNTKQGLNEFLRTKVITYEK